MKTEASVVINRPIDEVFEFTNNHVPEWSLTVTEDKIIESTPDRVGSTFLCVTEKQGSRMDFHGTVTRYDPPVASSVNLVGKQFDIDAAYKFEDLGGQTRVTELALVHPKGGLKIFFYLFGWMMKKAGCDALQLELNNLKQILERRGDSGPAAETQ